MAWALSYFDHDGLMYAPGEPLDDLPADVVARAILHGDATENPKLAEDAAREVAERAQARARPTYALAHISGQARIYKPGEELTLLSPGAIAALLKSGDATQDPEVAAAAALIGG